MPDKISDLLTRQFLTLTQSLGAVSQTESFFYFFLHCVHKIFPLPSTALLGTASVVGHVHELRVNMQMNSVKFYILK